MMMNYWHSFGWGGGFMMVTWILLIMIGIYLIFTFAGKSKNPEEKNASHETALDILNKRYASGEISREEYEEMKHDIQ